MDEVLRFPPQLFTVDWYVKFTTDSDWINAAIRTVIVGASATLMASTIGTMAAFAVIRGNPRSKSLVEAIAIGPLVIPPVVLAAGGYSLFLKLHLVGSYVGLSIMHAVLGVPYVYLIVSAALSRIDPNVELAALSLGARQWQTFRQVTLPTILPSVMTAALFAFLVSFDEVVVTVFLAGTLGPTLPVRIFSSLSFAVSPVVAAASTIQVIAAVVLLALLGILQRWQAARAQFGITTNIATN